MKINFNNKVIYSIVLLLAISGGLSLLLFKYYYWQLIDQQSVFPEYGYWLYLIAPFLLISFVSLFCSISGRKKMVMHIPLSVCIISALAVLYAPYAVLYQDVYDAFYDGNHESYHDKRKLLEMLKKKNYKGLEAYLTQIHDIVNNSPNKEGVLNGAYHVFTIMAENNLQEKFDEWVLKTDSFQAYTARGFYFSSQGWRVRSTRFMRDIPENNRIEMRVLFKKSVSDLQRAIEINPDNTAAYMKLISVYGVLGNTGKADQVLEAALNIYPYLYYARSIYMYYHLYPQWGGSHKMMHDFAMDARQYAIKNPRLMALTAEIYEDLAGREEKSNTAKAVQLYKKALEYAPLTSIYRSLARIYKKQSDVDNELTQYNKILKKNPYHSRALSGRINILVKSKRIEEAILDAEVLLNTRGGGWEASTAGWVYEHAKMYDKAVNAYKLSILDNPESEYSYERLIALNIHFFKDVTSALNVAISMEKAIPENPKGWLYAADYMYDLKMEEAIHHINQYFVLVGENIPKDKAAHQSAIRLLEDIKLRIKTNQGI